MSLSEELGTLKYSFDNGRKIGGQNCGNLVEKLVKNCGINSEKIRDKFGKKICEKKLVKKLVKKSVKKSVNKLHKIYQARLYKIGEQQKHIIYWSDIV